MPTQWYQPQGRKQDIQDAQHTREAVVHGHRLTVPSAQEGSAQRLDTSEHSGPQDDKTQQRNSTFCSREAGAGMKGVIGGIWTPKSFGANRLVT